MPILLEKLQSLLDPQANLKMGVIITNFGEYRRVCYYQPPYPELSEKYCWTSVIGSNVHHHFSRPSDNENKKIVANKYSPWLVMITLFLVITRRTISIAQNVGWFPFQFSEMLLSEVINQFTYKLAPHFRVIFPVSLSALRMVGSWIGPCCFSAYVSFTKNDL